MGDCKNHTARIGDKFSEELEEIKEKRISVGIDKKQISTRVLTNLLIRHELWEEIKKAMINYKFGGINVTNT